MTNEKKLEITSKLEDLANDGTLDCRIAVLNLPSANYCRKRTELVQINDGKLQQACQGCITQMIKCEDSLGIEDVKSVIDYFTLNYGTKFITINGRGDPFHPKLVECNLGKIRYAYQKYGIQAYVFTAGNDLHEKTCDILAENEANVMISLFGNQFIDAEFFSGKEYPKSKRPMQNQNEIAGNLRRLIEIYNEHPKQPKNGTTRVGMNYVVSERDIMDGRVKIRALKEAANSNNIFFVVNTCFDKNADESIQTQLEKIAHQYSDFGLKHSTSVNGQCQMGAGSAATVDYNGMLLRCPYMKNEDSEGRFHELSETGREKVLEGYMKDRAYSCVMRKHEKKD